MTLFAVRQANPYGQRTDEVFTTEQAAVAAAAALDGEPKWLLAVAANGWATRDLPDGQWTVWLNDDYNPTLGVEIGAIE